MSIASNRALLLLRQPSVNRVMRLLQCSFVDIPYAEQVPWEPHYHISHGLDNALSTCINIPGLVCLDQTLSDPENVVKIKLLRQNGYHAPLSTGEGKEK